MQFHHRLRPPHDQPRQRIERDLEVAMQRDLVHPEAVLQQVNGQLGSPDTGYGQAKKSAAQNAINAAWNWLVRNGLLLPAPGMNGGNGHHQISPEGVKLAASGDFESFKQAAAFPKALLHPAIREHVWMDLARGDYDTAVLKALREVEIAVRAAGNFTAKDVGAPLMRAAFDPRNGPLTDQSQEFSERESLAHLFAGAIGYHKNPQSHRNAGVSCRFVRPEPVAKGQASGRA